MTVIRANCPTCGEVDMGPDEVRLTLVRGGRGSSYEFTCPNCQDDIRKPADRRTVAILVSAGVDATTSDLPRFGATDGVDLEPMGSVCDDPPFTIDDVIDFHFLLLDDRWIEESLAEIRSR
jgi:predicted RNA-binding Zn-ribbon protein involved in translation (DUF1610 family)